MPHGDSVRHLHHASKVIPQYNEANYLTAVAIATRHNVSTCHQVRCISIGVKRVRFMYADNYNIPALVQIMAWRRPGDKPLSKKWWLVY